MAALARTWPGGFANRMQEALAATDPPGSDPSEIGRAVAAIMRAPSGTRPFRTLIDLADDSAAVIFPVADRLSEHLLHLIGCPELMHPDRAAARAREPDASRREASTRPHRGPVRCRLRRLAIVAPEGRIPLRTGAVHGEV